MPYLRQNFTTTDVDVALQMLDGFYDSNIRVMAQPDDPAFEFSIAAAGDETMQVHAMRFTAGLTTSTDRVQDPLVNMWTKGHCEWATPSDRGDQRRPAFIAPGTRMDISFGAIEGIVITVTSEVLEETARSITGSDSTRLRLSHAVPRNDPSYLQSLFLHLTREFVTSDVMTSSLLRRTAARSVAAAMLHTYDITEEHPALVVGTHHAASGNLRRATQYVDEHAREAITIDDIARAARLSTRGLHGLFRRELDKSPSEYLRHVRLEGARAELLRADVGAASLDRIAGEWGFGTASRLAARYREAYGDLPGEASLG